MYKSINSFNDEADGNDNLTHLPGVRTAKTNADAIIFKREIIFSVYITAYEGTIWFDFSMHFENKNKILLPKSVWEGDNYLLAGHPN